MSASAKRKTRTATITDIGRQYCARVQNELIYARGAWLEWTGTHWDKRHQCEQDMELWKILEEFHEKDGQAPSLGKHRALEHYARARLFVPETMLDAQTHYVNLLNGTYNMLDGQLYPHRPDHYLTTVLPFGHDPKASCPNWQIYLLTTFVKPRTLEYDQELVQFVQEAIGYSLTTDNSYHVTFWCVGEGANGKGVLFHVLEQLGGSATMALNVGLLAREQYQLAMLAGKRIALCSEASSTKNLVEDATVKALVSGDTMQVRQIRQEPFDLHPTAKLWWAMNELPAVADTSEGFWRRMRVIPFNRTFNKQERILNLKDMLDQELPGIFNWAMAGLQRLRDQGDFTEPQQVANATAQYREEANPVNLFVNENCYIDANASVQSGALYSLYKNWCIENTFKPHSSKNFKHEMQRLGFFIVRRGPGNFYAGLGTRTLIP